MSLIIPYVIQGALEIFKELPHEFVPAEDLPKLVKDKSKYSIE